MPDIGAIPEIPRRTLHIFYVLDTSGSMGGKPINQLNMGIEETIRVLKEEVAQKSADVQIKVAVLEFNSGAKWLNPAGPEDVENFIFEPLSAGGLTDVGAALQELDSKLSRKSGYLQSMTGAYLPIIFFMSDGFATDEYQKALAEANNNKWFRRATKIGVAMGDSPDITMIANVVGSVESVIRVDDFSLLGRIIKFASVTSSMLQSQSRTTSTDGDAAAIVKQVVSNVGGTSATQADIDQSQFIAPPPVPQDDPNDPWSDSGWK